MSLRVGGDPSSYMQAPSLDDEPGDSGNGSFIANLLDLLGVHRQVSKGPKEQTPQQLREADSKPQVKQNEAGKKDDVVKGKVNPDQYTPTLDKPMELPAQHVMNLLDSLGSSFSPSRGADQNNMMVPIDPDLAFPLKFKS